MLCALSLAYIHELPMSVAKFQILFTRWKMTDAVAVTVDVFVHDKSKSKLLGGGGSCINRPAGGSAVTGEPWYRSASKLFMLFLCSFIVLLRNFALSTDALLGLGVRRAQARNVVAAFGELREEFWLGSLKKQSTSECGLKLQFLSKTCFSYKSSNPMSVLDWDRAIFSSSPQQI